MFAHVRTPDVASCLLEDTFGSPPPLPPPTQRKEGTNNDKETHIQLNPYLGFGKPQTMSGFILSLRARQGRTNKSLDPFTVGCRRACETMNMEPKELSWPTNPFFLIIKAP